MEARLTEGFRAAGIGRSRPKPPAGGNRGADVPRDAFTRVSRGEYRLRDTNLVLRRTPNHNWNVLSLSHGGTAPLIAVCDTLGKAMKAAWEHIHPPDQPEVCARCGARNRHLRPRPDGRWTCDHARGCDARLMLLDGVPTGEAARHAQGPTP